MRGFLQAESGIDLNAANLADPSGIIAAKNSDFDSIVEVAQSLGMLGDK